MSQAVFKIAEGSDTALTDLLRGALTRAAGAVSSLVDKEVSFELGRPDLVNDESLATRLPGDWFRIHGEFKGDHQGRVQVLFDKATAIAFSNFLRMVPQELVEKNLAEETWTDEDAEALGEVGNVVFSAFDEAMKEGSAGKLQVALAGTEPLAGGVSETIGRDPHIIFSVTCRIGELPERSLHLLLPLETAEAVNGRPIRFHGEGAEDAADFEEIEEAPIRGDMSVYVAHPEVLRALRRSCRRIGLRFDKRPKGEVPNPAAQKGRFVFLEIAPGQERRFEWCLRLKEADLGILVAILLMEPTKKGVVLSFKAGADVILGWPVKERSMSEKLAAALEKLGAGAPEESDGAGDGEQAEPETNATDDGGGEAEPEGD